LFVAQSHVLDNVEQMDPSIPYVQPPLLLRNQDGKFTNISKGSGAVFEQDLAARGAAFGDLDNDGDIDLVMTALDDQPRVLYSNADRQLANWVTFKIEGTASARGAQGARLHIRTPSGREQWGYVTTAGSYISASDARVHFGLGEEEVIEWLEIRWPSGSTKTMRNIKSRQVLTVTEPEGTAP
jgi:hypothetical protein